MHINLTDQISGVRIFHAANIAKPVNVYIDDRLVVEGLKYSEVTNYLPVKKGRNNIKIRNTATGELLYNQTLTLDGNKFITISAISEKGDVDLIVIQDVMDHRFNPALLNPYFMLPQNNYQLQSMYQFPSQYQEMPVEHSCVNYNERVDETDYDIDGLPAVPILGNSARLRFVHLSANAPAVNLNLENGTRLFTDTKYKQITNYLPVGSGNQVFTITGTGSNQVVYTSPNFMLLPNQSYTLYAIGLLSGSPAFELVLLKDGI